MKLQKVSQTITPFAGISFVHEEFNKSGLLDLIDNYLGIRNMTGYQYGELFRTWFEVFFCGGEVAEDVQEHLRSTLENIPGNCVASPDTLLLTKQLKKGEMYDFDYDNQIIEHEKNDAKRTYKHTTGYFPGVATINDKIVYIENRDGNANVKISQHETLERAYELIEENGIMINRSRMDAGMRMQKILLIRFPGTAAYSISGQTNPRVCLNRYAK
jgi:hypothetical protein